MKIEQKHSNGRTDGAHDSAAEVIDVTGQLLVNVRKDFQVVFSLRSLIDSVSSELFARFLSALSDQQTAGADPVRAILNRQGLERSEGAAFGLTIFGERSLVDGQGNHAFFYVEQERQRNGVDAALRRINNLRRQYFDQQWIAERSTQVVQAILDGLNGLRSYGDHNQSLRTAVELVNELAEAAGEQVLLVQQGKASVEQRLEASTIAQRQSQAASKGKARDLFDRFRNASVTVPSASGSFLERELVTVTTRLSVLEVEKSVLEEIVVLLGEELRVDELASDTLEAARLSALDEARKSEWTRDYGMAGGELLLNSRALTLATITYAWGENALSGLINIWRLEYAKKHGGEDLMLANGGELTAEALAELNAIIREEVKIALEGLTIVDAVVALHAHGELDLQARLEASFKEASALKSLLAPYYERAMDLQCYASLTYAPSALPGTNLSFDRMMDQVKSVLAVKVETSSDPMDSECLLFYCEYFCVPLLTLNIYGELYEEFKDVMNESRFCPHPEIHCG